MLLRQLHISNNLGPKKLPMKGAVDLVDLSQRHHGVYRLGHADQGIPMHKARVRWFTAVARSAASPPVFRSWYATAPRSFSAK